MDPIILKLFATYLTCIVVGESVRPKRQSSTNYIIDIDVVVDSEMYSRWETFVKYETGEISSETIKTRTEGRIKEYVSLTIHQANLRLNSVGLNLPYSISMQVVAMELNASIPNLKESISVEDALKAFHNWIIGVGRNFDHSILMTSKTFQGVDLAGETVAYLGRAYVSKMCSVQGYSLSVAVDKGAFQSSYHLTHELGHSLGAGHDGNGTSFICPITDFYLMAPVGTNSGSSYHPWQFSKCSSDKINTTITDIISRSSFDTDIRNCLSSTLQPIKEFTDTINVKVGQMFPPDKQCQMLYGTSARACPDAGKQEDICTQMGCIDPRTPNKFFIHFAAEWTSCGDKKWCNTGRCVGDPSAPTIPDCFLGDSLTTINGNSCSQAIKLNPMLCYKSDVRALCCNSCKLAAAKNPASRSPDLSSRSPDLSDRVIDKCLISIQLAIFKTTILITKTQLKLESI